MLVGYVVVAEWVNPEGERELSLHTDPEDTPGWSRHGWLQAGLEWEDEEADVGD